MAGNTKIEWTEKTWNPLRGCSLVSKGCEHCYAMHVANRFDYPGSGSPFENLTRMTSRGPVWTGEVREVREALKIPLKWRKPARIFVNSMSDLFHEKVRVDYLREVFEVIRKAHWHTFQVLTKRAERLPEMDALLHPFPTNLWLGVSIESDEYLYRADYLRKTRARIRFLSLEPLLGPLPNLDLTGIGWVIVGGESGSNYRPMDVAWVEAIRDRCVAESVPLFVKQDSLFRSGLRGRLPDELWKHKDYPDACTEHASNRLHKTKRKSVPNPYQNTLFGDSGFNAEEIA